jgi:hypothetical protein
MSDGFATIPDASYLHQDDATRTDLWIAEMSAVAPLAPPPPERFGRGSSQLTPIVEPPLVPRSSTAPAYPLVARSAPRLLPPLQLELPRPSIEERPIAWGRVVAAIALMSALMGGAIARLAYHPRRAAAAAARIERAAEPAGSGVAVLPFENRSADPALGEAARTLAKVLADELAEQTMIELATPRQGDPARGAAAVVRGSLVADAAGGVRLRVELARRGGKPVTVLDRRAAPAELAAALRDGVPAFAGLLVEPRELPRHLELARLALVEDRPAIAIRHLRTILLHDPGHRDALYERAIAARWAEPPDAAIAAIRRALAAPLAPLPRDVLAAHRQLAEARFAEALTSFTALAARHPQEPHVLLGLFEAQLRDGRGAAAMATYSRLRRIEPRVQLGARDVLAYAAAHPDAPELAQ